MVWETVLFVMGGNMFFRFHLLTIGFIFCFCISTGWAQSTDKKDSELMEHLVQLAKKSSGSVYSICEIHDGKMRTEYIVPATRCHNCYSVAKLFAVTAIGILEDRGKVDTNELVYPIFKDQFPNGFDEKWKKVKIADVMTHRMGIESGFLDIDAEDSSRWPTTDFLQIVLSRPLKHEPGTESVYSDAAFYLISRIVTAKSGERLDDFLIRELFVPLNFAEYAFSKCPQGYPIGATGLYISTEDMAKLGQLYIQHGVYNGKRILSERFIDKVLARGFELHPVGTSGFAYAKGGMNGQLLYVNMKTKRTVAIHSFQGLDNMMECILQYDR